MMVREQYVRVWILWVGVFGLTIFLPGVLVYLRAFFSLRPAPPR